MLRPTLILFLTLGCVWYVSGDQIVVATMQKIFPYALPVRVKWLVADLNKETKIANSKSVLKKWAPMDWKAAGAKLDPKNPYSKEAYATEQGLAFIDYRYSLKVFINFMQSRVIASNFLTKTQANQMKVIFWESDLKAENNMSTLPTIFMNACAVKFKPTFPNRFQNLTSAFAKKHPKDVAKMGWKL